MAKLFRIFPDGCRMFETVANSPEMAYSSVACWYSFGKRIAVVDTETNEAHIYTRECDKNGNLKRIIEH